MERSPPAPRKTLATVTGLQASVRFAATCLREVLIFYAAAQIVSTTSCPCSVAAASTSTDRPGSNFHTISEIPKGPPAPMLAPRHPTCANRPLRDHSILALLLLLSRVSRLSRLPVGGKMAGNAKKSPTPAPNLFAIIPGIAPNYSAQLETNRIFIPFVRRKAEKYA